MTLIMIIKMMTRMVMTEKTMKKRKKKIKVLDEVLPSSTEGIILNTTEYRCA